MSDVSLWFERRFDFSFSAELRPNLFARLRGTPARLEDIFRGRPLDAIRTKPDGTKWSAQEHAGHLVDLEPLWLSRVEDYVAGKHELTPADLQNRKTHDANHNARAIVEILAEFRSARESLLDRVEHVEPRLFTTAIPHPRLKTPMRLLDHLFFVAEHDDHHLARIWELVGTATAR